MNRAWIPAGALASVSVAGLIALGPLTDSLGTKVSFEPVVTVPVTAPAKKFVAVSVSPGVVGKIEHASLEVNAGGGRAAPSTSGETGRVAVKTSRNPPSAPAVQSNSTPAAPSTSTPPPATKKKTVKRPTSISGSSASNGDEGLASGGSGGGSSVGEQNSKLGSDTNP
jgi:hypothetical protein